jgi:O-antigen ligase
VTIGGRVPLIIASVILGPLLAYLVYRSDRVAASRLVLWIGVVAPLAYSEPQTRSSLLTSGFSALEIARGLAPLACLVLARLLSEPAKRRLGLAEYLLAAYMALAFLSTLWSIAPKQTALKALVFIFSTLCIWGLVRRYASPTQAALGLAAFVHVTLIAIAVETLVAHQRTFTAGRLHGLFPQIASDVLGTMAVIGILALLFNIGPRALWSLPVRLVLGCVYAGELIASGTRSALIFGIVVVIFALLHWARSSSGRLALWHLGVGLTLVTFLVLAPVLQQRLQRNENYLTYSTLNGRTTDWAEALQAWSSSRLDGLGFYSGHRFAPVLQPGQGEPQNLDNTWIEALVDLGIAGTAVLGGFVLAANARIRRLRALVPHSTYVFVGATSIMYLATTFVNPTIAGNETFSFVIWSFTLLLLPTGYSLDREFGEPTLAANSSA